MYLHIFCYCNHTLN